MTSIPPELVRGEFVSTFVQQYVRNNKSAGQKNLRCFPSCSEAGHCKIGFCGGPIVAKATIYNPTKTAVSHLDYIAYGNFQVENINAEGSNAHIPELVATEGTRVQRAAVEAATRSDEAPEALLHLSSTVRKVFCPCLCSSVSRDVCLDNGTRTVIW
jgi:hypothetical protein